MILLDTGPIVAFFDASDAYHKSCIKTLKRIKEPLVTSWSVLTEAFYLLGFSWAAQDNLWEFIMRGGCGNSISGCQNASPLSGANEKIYGFADGSC